MGDQPLIALHLVNIGVAYELLEVRTGEHGLKTIYRTGKAPEGTVDAIRREMIDVLTKALGEDGEKKRAKLQELRHAVMQAWTENGPSKLAMESFLDSM